MLTKEEIEEKYFNEYGQHSKIKSEARRVELKKMHYNSPHMKADFIKRIPEEFNIPYYIAAYHRYRTTYDYRWRITEDIFRKFKPTKKYAF